MKSRGRSRDGNESTKDAAESTKDANARHELTSPLASSSSLPLRSGTTDSAPVSCAGLHSLGVTLSEAS
jgi:hypothetical protein